MNRASGGIFNLLSAISTFAVAAVLALWGTSYWRMLQLTHATPPAAGVTATTSFYVVNGGVQFWRLVGMDIGADRGMSFSTLRVSEVQAITPARALWFLNASSGGQIHYGVPCWAFAVMLAVMPAIRFRAWRRVRARLAGRRCGDCGYDLRASPGRCPECGAVPVGDAAA